MKSVKSVFYAALLAALAWLFNDRPPVVLTNLMLMLIFWALVTRE